MMFKELFTESKPKEFLTAQQIDAAEKLEKVLKGKTFDNIQDFENAIPGNLRKTYENGKENGKEYMIRLADYFRIPYKRKSNHIVIKGQI